MQKSKIKTYTLFIVLILLACYPLFVNLGSLSVRKWDEARNGINAIEMLQNGQIFVTSFDNQPDMWNTKPPFMIWMIALAMKFLGITAFALRLPSVLACLTIVIYGFWFSKKNLNSIPLGIVFGLVLSSSVGFIDYHASRNGDFDTMLTMWIFLYTTQFFIYLENRKNVNLILFSLSLGFAILTKGIAGCMVLPGLFIYIFSKKNYLSVFKSKTFYVLPTLGILLGVSYYLIRERLNPGYINAVMINEITGRFMETNEGHTGTVWYYLDMLRDNHYKYWIYVLPCALTLVFARGDANIKKFTFFIFLQALIYYIVISISHTKLPWYDAPLFPLFALIIGAGFAQLQKEIYNLNLLNNLSLKRIAYCVITISLFIIPIQNILATSIGAKKETYYPEQFYGDFIASVCTVYPSQKHIKVVSEDYNPHLLFYTTLNKIYGRTIEIVNTKHSFTVNDSVLITEKNLLPKLGEGLVFDTLYEEDNIKYFMRVVSSSEYSKNKYEKLFMKKLHEIEKNKEWKESIEKKAISNKNPYEKQLMMDALWSLTESKEINIEEQDSLRVKYKF